MLHKIPTRPNSTHISSPRFMNVPDCEGGQWHGGHNDPERGQDLEPHPYLVFAGDFYNFQQDEEGWRRLCVVLHKMAQMALTLVLRGSALLHLERIYLFHKGVNSVRHRAAIKSLIKFRMSDYNNEKYPVGALKPKAETKVLNFLAKFPSFNGEDVVIAILDSGVDPNSSGLQVNTFSYQKRLL